MPSGAIAASEDHLNRLAGTSALRAVVELVTNALDAEAANVDVRVETDGAGEVRRVVVTDDGHGFTAAEVPSMFFDIGGSWKSASGGRTRNGLRRLVTPKANNYGRLAALAIGDEVEWISVVAGEGGMLNEGVRVETERGSLAAPSWQGPFETYALPGTVVKISATRTRAQALLGERIHQRLSAELAVYLAEYPRVTVTCNGRRVGAEGAVRRYAEVEVEHPNGRDRIHLEVTEWAGRGATRLSLHGTDDRPVSQFSRRLAVSPQAVTACARWDGFDALGSVGSVDADGDQAKASIRSDPVVQAVEEALREQLTEWRADEHRAVIKQWRDEDVYPYDGEPQDDVERAARMVFDNVAVLVAPKVNTIRDRGTKRLNLGLMKVALEENPESVAELLFAVLTLTWTERTELVQLIRKTPLSALIETLSLVTSRLEVVTALDHLVHDDVSKTVREQPHLHRLVEQNPWLFGEEYALHTSDRGLTRMLHDHLHVLGREPVVGERVTDLDGRNRRVDFLLARLLKHPDNRWQHLVVEIKRPGLVLGRKELDQIEDYARTVSRNPRFDTDTVEWRFLLIGTHTDDLADDRRLQRGRERYLVSDPDRTQVRIWVKKWAEVLGECRHRLQFVRERLQYDPTVSEALGHLRRTNPAALPDALRADEPEVIDLDDERSRRALSAPVEGTAVRD